MKNTAIFLPAAAMVFWTFAIILYMGRKRMHAVKQKQINLSYFKINEGEKTPEHLIRISQHYNNLFEVNSLFYIALIVLFVIQATSSTSIVLAWLYVASRITHSMIHLRSNNVKQRFLYFVISLLLLSWLWLLVVIGIV